MQRLAAVGLVLVGGAVLIQTRERPAAAAKAEFQPLAAQAKRIVETLDHLGAPLKPADRKAVLDAANGMNVERGAATIERVLDRYALLQVQINPESRVKVTPGVVKPELVEQGWRTYLVKVTNEAGVTAPLNVESPNTGRLANTPKEQLGNRWLEVLEYTAQPLKRELSGLETEYRVFSFYSRDAGKREARLAFNVGQGTQDLGFRNDVDVLFAVRPSVNVTLRIQDTDRQPTTAGPDANQRRNRLPLHLRRACGPRPLLREGGR